MNRIFKRKLVFVKVCSPFSFIRVTNAEKIKKKKKKEKDVRRSLSWVPVLQIRVLPVQSSPVQSTQYSMPSDHCLKSYKQA